MGYYWKQGLIAGLAVGFVLHILMQQLAARSTLPTGNVEMEQPGKAAPVTHHTPLGPLMGLTIFALCMVMPGPDFAKVGE